LGKSKDWSLTACTMSDTWHRIYLQTKRSGKHYKGNIGWGIKLYNNISS
jgi:hypothetical protein